jgi:hypothetical protein
MGFNLAALDIADRHHAHAKKLCQISLCEVVKLAEVSPLACASLFDGHK